MAAEIAAAVVGKLTRVGGGAARGAEVAGRSAEATAKVGKSLELAANAPKANIAVAVESSAKAGGEKAHAMIENLSAGIRIDTNAPTTAEQLGVKSTEKMLLNATPLPPSAEGLAHTTAITGEQSKKTDDVDSPKAKEGKEQEGKGQTSEKPTDNNPATDERKPWQGGYDKERAEAATKANPESGDPTANEAYQKQVDAKIDQKMAEWEERNKPPDISDKDAYNDWLDQQTAAMADITRNVGIDAEKDQWAKDHPMPDSNIDPEKYKEKYKKWLMDRKKMQEDVSEKYAEKKNNEKKDDESKKKEMSAREIAEKTQRLKQLQVELSALDKLISTVNGKKDKTGEDHSRLLELNGMKDLKRVEANLIVQELGTEITNASPMKKVAIIMAIVAAMGTALVSQASTS